MKFKKFCEIENSYNSKFITYISQYLDLPCVVLNKVDGANFSILVDYNGNIRFATRNQITDNNTFNCGIIFDRIKTNILDASNNIFNDYNIYGELDTVQFVGEIFGGYYPHPEVERVSKAQSIQGRIFYIPDNDIIFYDIILNYKNGNYKYLNWNDAKNIYTSNNLKIVDIIEETTIDKAIEKNYDDLIDPTYKQYNLPEIENNFSEGVIIKPLEEVTLNNGDRLIIKIKSSKFMEKKHKSYKEDFNIDNFSGEFKKVYNNIFDYITESRYYSVISKLDPSLVNQKNFGTILKNYNEDVIKDFNKEFDNVYEELDKKDKRIINKEINKRSAKIIEELLIKQSTYNFSDI